METGNRKLETGEGEMSEDAGELKVQMGGVDHPLARELGESIHRLYALAKRDHYWCEDEFYSCPKHPDGSANPQAGDECDCGADEHNAERGTELVRLLDALNAVAAEAQRELHAVAKAKGEAAGKVERLEDWLRDLDTVLHAAGWWSEPEDRTNSFRRMVERVHVLAEAQYGMARVAAAGYELTSYANESRPENTAEFLEGLFLRCRFFAERWAELAPLQPCAVEEEALQGAPAAMWEAFRELQDELYEIEYGEGD